MLSALASAYDRLASQGKLPGFGYSNEKVGFLIALDADGQPVGLPHDLRGSVKGKQVPAVMSVPQPPRRTSGIAPVFLWDKTAYVLGVTAGPGKRTAQEHQAFLDLHRQWLAGTTDEGLLALSRFLDWWTPDLFAQLGWPGEMVDQNVVFALEKERLRNIRIHDRPAARQLWAQVAAGGDKVEAICLISGERAPIARLHPSIKGVWGAQSAGAAIVSFNLDAFTSHGKEQGFNAPISEASAFAYTTALNAFLSKDSNHRIQFGDASTVFWASAPDPETAEQAENVFVEMAEAVDEEAESRTVGNILQQIRAGVPLATIAPCLAEGVRFHVLGLAPNVARLSVRFWYDNDFRDLVANYQAYVADIRLDSGPEHKKPIRIRSLVLRTGPARKDKSGKVTFDADGIPPLLAGELLRAILTGGRFPGAALAQLLMRVRADGVIDKTRAAFIKAIIVRNMRLEGRLPRRADGQAMEDYLVSSDPEDLNPARLLGRLFALIEDAQLAALGKEINSTVKDKYFGSAAATPQRILARLVVNAEQHHIKRLLKDRGDPERFKKPNDAVKAGLYLSRRIGELWAQVGDKVPAQQSAEEQGTFLVGYYEERNARRPKKQGEASEINSKNDGADDAPDQAEGDVE